MDFNAYQQTLATELRGRECPFPEAEYQQRLKHLRARMHADGLGAVLLTDPSATLFDLPVRSVLSDRLQYL